jgi:hypothetical protein
MTRYLLFIILPRWNHFTRQTLPTVNSKHLIVLCIDSFPPPKKLTTILCSSVVHPSSTCAIFTTEKAFEHGHARLLPRLSWSWTVLLPSDTHRKPITSITAVLLPFVTYLLILPRTLADKVFWRSGMQYWCLITKTCELNTEHHNHHVDSFMTDLSEIDDLHMTDFP